MSAVRTRDFATVGKSVARVDAAVKVRGEAIFLDDIVLPGMLFGKVLRSRFPHARILSIDTTEAEKLPGVKAVVTGMDLPWIHGESLVDEPFLARGKVRYMGEGVAAVAAVDEETAEAALDLIRVEYEALPAIFDPEEAMQPGAPLIHEAISTYAHPPIIEPVPDSNICNRFQLVTGDVEKGFQEADLIFEDTFTTPMQQHCSLEAHGAIAQVDTGGKVTLWATNDSPYRARKELADALKIPLTHVRVIAAYLGGNFGGKGGLKAEPAAVVLALKVRNRPVKVMFSREEEFTSSLVRHPTVTHMKTGVMKDGRIVARQVTTIWDTGAYAEKGPTVSRLSGMSAAGPYQIPNVKLDGYVVYTNKQVAGAMRGYGGPQVCWAYESQMDTIAARLGMDPLELRLKNCHGEGDVHYTGQQLYSVGLKECLEEAGREIGWGQPATAPYRGRGIACMERGIKTPFASAAFVKVNEDGTVEVLSSTTEVGQGSETILC
ncbi:MAG: molybdopterin-dependent oxidoreductase, partial [Chloroflexi bacterium]|nr:molybdopterin-dependent oxidoreductase [Chloroflexota bacterium]